ncbi:MAG: diguanylate cyclase [Gammaproteobacteria bacterium]|jgi:two-component system cell cycle response regulator|nr:diguanylate cyclase [Gammaproteobacteria bacterium]
MHILIVDHSKVVRTVWNKMVADLGHQSLTVESAEEAIEILQSQEVEFICASLSLPGMNGIALCKQVRALSSHHKTPFILLTSTQDKTSRQEAFEAGVTEIQEKMDKEQLAARLKQYLSEEQHELTGRVLYIEDSMVAAHVMIKILRHMNLQVDHFRSADEALAAFEKHDYDMIVSDILLEGVMSGVGLVNRVRSYLSDKRRVPILALSGMDETTRRIELFRLGVNDYIAKPPVEEEVRARVRNLIISKQLFDRVQAQSRQLYQLAMQDHLTGLYNRTGLNELSPKYFAEATSDDAPLSLMLIDLDHFKNINDTHGHVAGDKVLALTSAMLKNACREEDLVARVGGEEFVMLMGQCGIEQAAKLAESVRKKIEALKPDGIQVTASIGVTGRPLGKEVGFDDLFKAADRAVYEAKNQGRNRVVTMLYN